MVKNFCVELNTHLQYNNVNEFEIKAQIQSVG